jgi:PhoD related phosphatase
MNPIEVYHDPSLDGLLSQNEGMRRQNSVRRRSNGHEKRPMPVEADYMPPAPEVPRGPPISYRGPPVDAGPQKSFSQRAKGRPYAKEAFADPRDYPAVPPPRQPRADYAVNGRGSPQTRGPPPADLRVNTKDLIGEDALRSRDRERSVTSATGPGPESQRQSSQRHARRTSDTAPHREQPNSEVSRSSAAREAPMLSDDPRRDWAPDRSPLQKLEVTLNDISKEEKRARVQEAEMLLRESKGKRVASEPTAIRLPTAPSKRSMSRREAQPGGEAPRIEDAGLVRNLSSTQRTRLQHSTTIDNHQPDQRRLSAEGRRGFNYSQSPAQPPNRVTAPATSRGPPERREARYPDRDPSSRSQRKEDPDSLQRSADGRAPEAVQSTGVPSNISRAVSMQQRQPPAQFADDVEYQAPELADRQRNASHKAALAQLTGDPEAGPVARSGSRKLQKPLPQDIQHGRTRQRDVGPTIVHQSMDRPPQPGPIENRTKALPPDPMSQPYTPPPKNRDPAGLGVLPTAQTSSPMSGRVLSDGVRPRQKTSSVTFKEPANRRPVDEWKDAQTAKLSLADYALDKPVNDEKYKAWWEQNAGSDRRRRRRSSTSTRPDFGRSADPIEDAHAEFSPTLFVRCGPLLRYLGMKRTAASADGKTSESETWRGSVMIVTQDSHSSYEQAPTLRLFSRPKALLAAPPAEVTGELAPEHIDPIAGLTKMSRVGRPLYVRPVDHLVEEKDLSQLETDDGLFESSPSLADVNGNQGTTTATTNNRNATQDGEHVGRYQEVQGARLYADPERNVTFWRFNIEVELANVQQHIAYRINRGASTGFWVPARGQTMNIMFHSCNGFSLSVNPNQFSGPDPLWRDVLNVHQTRPFHVMIGGGDQIYNDRVLTETRHFGEWSRLRNPHIKHEAPFTPEMKEELESFYLNRYAMWFSQGLFGMAGSQIPMVNVWDDHDIIDGFGSYPDHFMRAPVFSGIGNIAFKYYMLFQHQSVAEETSAYEPSWVLGHEPGPYIHQPSRNIFMDMGKHVAFLGIDCRTERMRDEILSIRTFDLLLDKCRKELVEGETKHLIVLLGVPIAYPRLVWLENVLTSKALDPIKALGRAGILKGGFLNKFDGGVEILDDLDDHWTASHHKSERNDLIKELQDLAAEKSVRITILGGDVHLAAIGQFHSNPKLKIPKDRDHRYMPNVISSAIVNTPPPDMMADILNKRNKTHHLDKYTDENMIPMFTHDVDHKKRNNKHLLPRRNWCSIREYTPGLTPPPSPPSTPSIMSDKEEHDLEAQPGTDTPRRRFSLSRDDVNPRNLIRRLSSRNAPPSSYRDGTNPPFRSASYDGSQPTNNGSMLGSTLRGSGSQRASFDSQEPTRRASSFDHTSSGAPLRPGMLRRPTNLSEKAARKGNVPAVDADGNEIDVNDHVNLEGGLDIVLNVEVNQKDPAGITTPYRLLVPALWYDGSSDREKLTSAADVHRKPTLLNRFGIGGRQKQSAAKNQGQGNWGQDASETESYADSEDMQKAPPRRRFSLFGNRRRKKEEFYSDEESEQEDDPQGQRPGFAQPPQANSMNRQVSAPATQTQPVFDPQPQQGDNRRGKQGHNDDALYDTTNRPPNHHFTQPTQAPIRRSLTIGRGQKGSGGNDPRSVSDNYPVQQQQPRAAVLPPSYTKTQDSAYERQSQYNTASPSTASAAPAPSTAMPQRRLSKQERILGIGSEGLASANSTHMPGMPLRGSGIIGNPNAYPDNNGGGQRYSGGGQGYSGVEAYKEPKPRRGFSFKKARNWLDGRRDEQGYDDEYGHGNQTEEQRDDGGHKRRMY